MTNHSEPQTVVVRTFSFEMTRTLIHVGGDGACVPWADVLVAADLSYKSQSRATPPLCVLRVKQY